MQTSYDETAVSAIISDTSEWLDLVAHVQDIEKVHLKDLLQDADRTEELSMESDGVYADFSRQRVTPETVKVLSPPCTSLHISSLRKYLGPLLVPISTSRALSD